MKELFKVLIILHTVSCQKKRPSVPLIFRKLVSMSPLAPLLAWKVSFVQELIKYQARDIDLLVVLLLDGVVESVNQLLLVLYFAVYINKTGLDVTNVISCGTNAVGVTFKLAKVVLAYLKRRRERGLHASSSSSSSSSAPRPSVLMMNLAFGHREVESRSGKL